MSATTVGHAVVMSIPDALRTPPPVPPTSASATLDPERARQRVLVGFLGERLDHLADASPGNGEVVAARAALAELVDLLRLGPEPEVRICPTCGNVGMRLATRCGFCWTALAPATGAGTT